MRINWNGVYPAVTTKFTANDTLDLPAFGLNLDAQVQAGVSGIIIGGSLGEASTVTLDEKEHLVKYAVDRAGVPVLLNVAEGSTREAVRQAGLAPRWGARGLMLLPPMRYKASDHRETVAFFKASSPNRPTYRHLLVYNITPLITRLRSRWRCSTNCWIYPISRPLEESTRDITNVTRLINRFGDRLQDPHRRRSHRYGSPYHGRPWMGGRTRSARFPPKRSPSTGFR